MPLLLIFLFSCSNNATNTNTSASNISKQDSSIKEKQVVKPSIAYEVINRRDNSSNLNYDIYLKDTSKIKTLNAYLVYQYNPSRKIFLSINYFNNRNVAKTYFKKQFSESVSENEKDRLFKNYIAVYKFNPSTNFDQLSFLHQ
jgi:hypothetical protein